MKTALSSFIATALFITMGNAGASSTAAEAQRFFYQKGSVTLVVMVANDDCCNYDFASAGWVASSAQAAPKTYRCHLTIGEVDVALACYHGQNKGRIGTRVVKNENSCPSNTVMLLASAGVANIIQGFERLGYPDGCNADGCPGAGSGGEASG